MKNLHIRFDYAQSIEDKKQLLSSQAELLELLKAFKEYKHSRKRESILKQNLKKRLTELKDMMFSLYQNFPQESEEDIAEIESLRKEKKKSAPKEKVVKQQQAPIQPKIRQDNNPIESELRAIREKLARLG
jgi:hypothetical protein